MMVLCVCSEHYSHSVLRDSDLILPARGELVVVRCTANERWYRACVIGRDLEHNIKVVCSLYSILYFLLVFSQFCALFYAVVG